MLYSQKKQLAALVLGSISEELFLASTLNRDARTKENGSGHLHGEFMNTHSILTSPSCLQMACNNLQLQFSGLLNFTLTVFNLGDINPYIQATQSLLYIGYI